ncbi:MAG: hypothetical protein A7316_11045 [Candidatus Altiarchaeales archaeon WOR_SM1_86-2]|nr:MAG: hypothetical protein A7316_11045 [Candidatus Altiarchaeales archaeon WOR_SM1_86-2]
MDDLILLVHSCNSRKWLWPHWEKCFKRSGWDIDYAIIDGDEAFSDQLINALNSRKERYLFYTLDDYFIRFCIDFEMYLKWAYELEADALRLQPNVRFNSLPYRFERRGELLKQTKESQYYISMATSIWRREYFLECLKPGLSPWEVERSDCELGDVYFVPGLPFWYIDGTRRGVLTEAGKEILEL